MRFIRDASIIFIISLATVATVEGFFQINDHFHFLKPLAPPETRPLMTHKPWVDSVMDTIHDAPDESIVKHYPDSLKNLDRDGIDFSFRYVYPYDFSLHIDQEHSRLVTKTGEVIYDVTYAYDQNGRRKIDETNVQAEKFLLAIGDSFTLGEGVQQNEAYPSQLAKINQRYQVYNLGWHGFAPNDILSAMMKGSPFFWNDIQQQSGSVIYAFIPPHYARTLAGSAAFGDLKYILEKPYYELENGKLVEKGSFQKNRPVKNFLLDIWSKSAFLRFFNIQWPLAVRESDGVFFADFLKQIRSLYAEKFTLEHFYIVIWPGTPEVYTRQLMQNLPSDQFTILDYSSFDLNRFVKGDSQIAYDKHPTPAAYWLMAHMINSALDGNLPP